MRKIFDKQNINSKRQIELDISRGLAVLFMITVHILEVFSSTHVLESSYGSFVLFLGGPPAAPVFMFLLGIGIVYSRKASPKILFKRGLIIFLLGYVLNFLRGTLPSLIHFVLNKDNQVLENALYELLAIDILQFAGLTLLCFSLIKKLNLSLWMISFFGLLCSAINFSLVLVKTNHIVLSSVSGLIWGSSEISYFPFLSWIIYPLAGYIFGTFLIRCYNKKRFYATTLISSLVLLFVLGFFIVGMWGIDIGLEEQYAYYHHDIFGAVIFLSFILLWISLIYFISKKSFRFLKTTIERWSKNVTIIYFIHWVIIGFLTLAIPKNSINLAYTLILTLIIIVVTDILSIFYVKKTNQKMIK